MSNIRTGQLSPLVYRQLQVSSSPIGRFPDKISNFRFVQPISFKQQKPTGEKKRETPKFILTSSSNLGQHEKYQTNICL